MNVLNRIRLAILRRKHWTGQTATQRRPPVTVDVRGHVIDAPAIARRDFRSERDAHKALVSTAQSGFTLIELLVSIAIVAILSGAAAYAYSGYSNNAQVSEAMRMLDGAETTVAGTYQTTGAPPGNAAEAGLNQNPGKYVASLNIGGAGVLWAVFNDVNPALNGLVLTMTPYTSSTDPSAPIVWLCGFATIPAGATWTALAPDAAGQGNAAPAATTVPASYLPRSCRAG